MENTNEDSITKEFASPIKKHKKNDIVDPTQDPSGKDAKFEGGKSSVGGGEGSSENQSMELTSGGDRSKPQSSVPIAVKHSVQESTDEITNSEDPSEKSTSTSIISLLFEGECEVTIDEKISEEKGSPHNNLSIQEIVGETSNVKTNVVDTSDSHKHGTNLNAKIIRPFDLNDPPVNEDKGREFGDDEKPIGNENSPPTHQGFRGLDPNQQMEEDQLSTNNDAAYETPIMEHVDCMEKNEEELIAEKGIEVDSSVKEKTGNGGTAKVFEFDLNEIPAEKDKKWF